MKKNLGQKIHSMGVELWQNLFVVIDRGPAGFGVADWPQNLYFGGMDARKDIIFFCRNN